MVTPQRMSRETMSVMVVINGFAKTAGSIRIAFANSGTQQPTIFATMTAIPSATAMASEIYQSYP